MTAPHPRALNLQILLPSLAPRGRRAAAQPSPNPCVAGDISTRRHARHHCRCRLRATRPNGRATNHHHIAPRREMELVPAAPVALRRGHCSATSTSFDNRRHRPRRARLIHPLDRTGRSGRYVAIHARGDGRRRRRAGRTACRRRRPLVGGGSTDAAHQKQTSRGHLKDDRGFGAFHDVIPRRLSIYQVVRNAAEILGPAR